MFGKNKNLVRRANLQYGAARNRRTPHNGSGFSGILLFAMVLLALMLLVLDKTGNRQLHKMRSKALDLAAPALELAAIPAGYIQRSIDRVERFYETDRKLSALQKENRRLRGLKWNIDKLKQKNQRLKALLNSAREVPLKFVSGRIISGNPGLFGHHMVVNLGERNGIHSGFAVINEEGFIGRTLETGARSSRILLITDKASRIPVLIGEQGVRGMAIGTGSPYPKIDFLPPNAAIYEGDSVFTSGHGGELPRGLRIGVVKKIGNQFHIEPAATQPDTEYVSILLFDRPDLADNRH